ncbi:MAG TPA: lysylphosphatidylglycerol synthase transmembrane domain-containing protein [Anaerolineae bacterium]|nr:lysylphosphatidylglycerol synthase transmembrane domain-containing protein [Anaerolineae bacterium]HNU04708.1 lysylphosphatidylglycerol synthase transmembrane domain-containing protein [Anaerolineae bacterium]
MKKHIVTVAKIAITVGLIAFAFSRVELRAVRLSLAAANPWLILLALGVYLLAITINGAKWHVLLRALDVGVPFRAALQYMFVGFFFNSILPANIGGDVMRGYGMARYTDRTAEAAVSVVVDRIVGLLAYMSTAAVTAIVVVRLMNHAELQWLFNLAVATLLGIAVALAVMLSRRLRVQIGRIFHLRPLSRLAPVYDGLSGALDAYRFRYRALFNAYLLGLAGLMAANVVNWLLFEAVGGGVPFVDVLLFNPLIALVLMLPISVGGHGVIQNAYPFFYTLLGVPEIQAIAVSVLMSFVIILGSLPGGLLWLRIRRAGEG